MGWIPRDVSSPSRALPGVVHFFTFEDKRMAITISRIKMLELSELKCEQ
jgi:hypothetical protein